VFGRLLMAAGWLAVSAAAAPPLTTIQDVLYKADGTRFSGTLTITWSSFQPAAGAAMIPQGSTVVKVLNGYLRVQLTPTTTAVPPLMYWVLYTSNGVNQFRERWAVPSSATPLPVAAVRVQSSVSGNEAADTAGSSGPVAESNVTGLLADLAARPVKGPSFAAGRMAWVDASGMLGSVSGNPTDCVHVDGSTGTCGSAAPSFIDGDTLAGLVDGSNTSFGLSQVPNPAASLSVFRNGVLQKAGGQDYALSGSTIQFAAGSIPQPGDTLLASYRVMEAGIPPATPPATMPQVICSGSGSSTNSTALTAIATCTIPAGLLQVGDRLDIRFDLAHAGSAGGFSWELHWGSTTMVHRDAPASETLATGRTDASVIPSGAQTSSQTWGSALPFQSAATNATDLWLNGLTVTVVGSVAQAADSLTAANLTVIRIP